MADEHVHKPAEEENPDVGYEVADANVRQVVFAGLGIAAVTVLACFLMYFLFNLLKHTDQRALTVHPMAPPPTLPPGPHLEDKPWVELQRLHAKEDQVLQTYGWVNKSSGTVRIPISKAMDIVAQKGLKATSPAPVQLTPGQQGQPEAMPRNSASPGVPILKEGSGAAKQQ